MRSGRILLALAALCAASPARAEIALHEADGKKFTVNLTLVQGVFSMRNADFGVGNFNASSTATARDTFLAGDRKRNRTWSETAIKLGLAGEAALSSGTLYAGASALAQRNFGGDGNSSLAPQGARSSTSDSPSYLHAEEYFAGWRSDGDLFDFSAGNQNFILGDGFVVASGAPNGWGRAALSIGLGQAFANTAILRVNAEDWRGHLFHLETATDQRRMRGNDTPKSRVVGFNLDRREKSDKPNATSLDDVWAVGVSYLRVYSAESTRGAISNGLGAQNFAFNPAAGSAGEVLPAGGAREGLNVYSARVFGAPFAFDRDILAMGEYVLQHNTSANRAVRASGWYLEPGYRFSALPWSPTISYRRAWFSGDSSPTDRTKNNYDPLFTAAGQRGYGSWAIGEIYGQYLGPMSNLAAHMLHLRATPFEGLDIGLIGYRHDFASVAQFNNAAVTSRKALAEIDAYAVWAATDFLTVSGLIGWARPMEGFKQLARQQVAGNTGYPALSPGTRTDADIWLTQMVLQLKF
jgi:hypothetical protein